MTRWSTEDFKGSKNTLYDAIMMETHRMCNPKRESNATYTLWVTVTRQCKVTGANTCTTLARDADHERGCACVEVGGVWEVSTHPHKFCSEPKTTLKVFYEQKTNY